MTRTLKGGGSRSRKRERKCVTTMAQIRHNATRVHDAFFYFKTQRSDRQRVINKVFSSADCRCAFFVSSSQPGRGPRMYTIHKQCGGPISTVGEPLAYRSADKAFRAARRAAAWRKV